MRPLPLFLVLAVVSATVVATASPVGLENVTFNGSVYYHVWNQGTIENNSWFSSDTSQMSNGNGLQEALERMDWLTMGYSVARFTGTQVTQLSQANLSAFAVYGFSDNSTYWQLVANRSTDVGRPALLTLEHSQGASDDFVTQTWTLNISGNLNLAYDVFLVETLSDFSQFSEVFWSRNNTGSSVYLNSTQRIDNVTGFAVQAPALGKAWMYRVQLGNYGNALIVDNGTVYFGMYLGRRLSGDTQYSLQKIDAGCTVSCLPGDVVIVDTDFYDDSGEQAGHNVSATAWWTDSLGTCTVSSACVLQVVGSDPYLPSGSTYLFTPVREANTTLSWLYCQLQNSSHGCEIAGGLYSAQKTAPAKDVHYTWQLFHAGVYRRSNWIQEVQVLLETAFSSNGYAAVDNKAPNISCTYNGLDLLSVNNTVLTVASTNDSHAYANVTFVCYYDNFQSNYSGTGLVNVSFISLNKTGWGLNVTDLPDMEWGLQTITYELAAGSRYKLTSGVNGTNAAAIGSRDRNWTMLGVPTWAYEFGINIVTPVETQPFLDPFMRILLWVEAIVDPFVKAVEGIGT